MNTPAHSDYGVVGLLITMLGTIATLFIQNWFQAKKAERDRNWDIQERERVATELRTAQEDLLRNQVAVQQKLAETSKDLKINTNLTEKVADKVKNVADKIETVVQQTGNGK